MVSVQGGIIGQYCTHKYAHTNRGSIQRLPYALKGVDAVVYAIFSRGFGFKVHLRPVLDDYRKEEWLDREYSGDIVGDGLHGLLLNVMSTEDGDMAEVWPRSELLPRKV